LASTSRILGRTETNTVAWDMSAALKATLNEGSHEDSMPNRDVNPTEIDDYLKAASARSRSRLSLTFLLNSLRVSRISLVM
jgi:hypothetical protein